MQTECMKLQLGDRNLSILAYSWKTRPRMGVRFDILDGEGILLKNCGATDVLGFLAKEILTKLESMVVDV